MIRVLAVAAIVGAELLGAHRAALLLAAAVAVVVIGLRLLRWLIDEVKRLIATCTKYAAGILLALALGLCGHHVTAPQSGATAPSYAGIAFAATALIAIAFATFLALKVWREAASWRTA